LLRRLTDGGFRRDDTFVPLPLYNVTTLSEAFRRAVLRLFVHQGLMEEEARGMVPKRIRVPGRNMSGCAVAFFFQAAPELGPTHQLTVNIRKVDDGTSMANWASQINFRVRGLGQGPSYPEMSSFSVLFERILPALKARAKHSDPGDVVRRGWTSAGPLRCPSNRLRSPRCSSCARKGSRLRKIAAAVEAEHGLSVSHQAVRRICKALPSAKRITASAG
jgi:hypothetical protein